jgi:hypothetical protein
MLARQRLSPVATTGCRTACARVAQSQEPETSAFALWNSHCKSNARALAAFPGRNNRLQNCMRTSSAKPGARKGAGRRRSRGGRLTQQRTCVRPFVPPQSPPALARLAPGQTTPWESASARAHTAPRTLGEKQSANFTRSPT